MTNSRILKSKIESSGMTKVFISEQIGISRHSLDNKIDNKTEFKATEIVKLSNILNLSKREQETIFFADNVIINHEICD